MPKSKKPTQKKTKSSSKAVHEQNQSRIPPGLDPSRGGKVQKSDRSPLIPGKAGGR